MPVSLTKRDPTSSCLTSSMLSGACGSRQDKKEIRFLRLPQFTKGVQRWISLWFCMGLPEANYLALGSADLLLSY